MKRKPGELIARVRERRQKAAERSLRSVEAQMERELRRLQDQARWNNWLIPRMPEDFS